MNCPTCGARNPDAASWCTQCFVTLDTSTAPSDDAVVPSPSVGSDDAVVPGPSVGSDDAAVAGSHVTPARAGDVRVTGELVEWRCQRCDGWNVLESAVCAACGAPREGFATGTPSTEATVPLATARFASVVLPGLGHLLRGAVGSGLARMLLFVLWVAGGLSLVGGAPLGGAALILGAVVLWATTLIDVERLVAGQRELLGARGLGALVAAVTVLLVLGIGLRVAGA